MLPELRHVDVREHRPAPAVEALGEQLPRLPRVGRAAPARLRGEGAEAQQVQLAVADGQTVPTAHGDQDARPAARRPCRLEQPAQLPHVAGDEVAARRRRPAAPQGVDDLLLGDDLPRLDRQEAEQCALPGDGERHVGAVPDQPQRAEHPDPDAPRLPARGGGRGRGQKVRRRVVRDLQSGEQPADGRRVRPRDPVVFDVAEGADADPGRGGKALLGEAGAPPVAADERPERRRRHVHREHRVP